MIVDYLHQPLPTIDTFFVLLIHQFLQMFLIKTILLWRLVSTHPITAMATSCFNSSPMATTCGEEDSIILFSASNSNSPDDDFSSASSSFSSSSISTPNLPYSLSLINLSYTINVSSSLFQTPNPVKILNSVSFTAQSSKIMAVIGPSGTGKSTLLKIISGRVNYKQLDPSSAILINGGRISDYDQLRRVCGFVPQDDDLLPLLTVKETLMYSAKFNLRDSMMMPKEREERVESLLRDLGLVLVKDSFVGEGDEEERGVSGGERKRVSIAVEMIRDPPILLLDEPTSGLDSRSSLQVIELLASMAKSKQRTVVLSIHQPSYRILDYISDYLLLSRGSVVHCGNLESLEESITKLGFQIPAQLNPIEFAMEIVDSLRNSNSNSGAIPIPIPEWIWPSSEEEIKDDWDRIKQKFHLVDIAEISFLCSRFCKIIYRTKQLFFARTMQAVVAGLGLGSVYTRVSRDEEGVAERLGLFAFSLSFLLSSTVEALPIYLHERRVLMKESSRGAYRISSYMIANTIAFLPFLFVVSILFSIPVYWIVGLNPSFEAFCFFILVVWLIILMASSLVLFLSAVSPDFISGNSLICTVLGAFFLFSGYFIPKENIPKPWMFMYYVSLYRYPLESMLVNEYWSVREECFSSGRNSSRCLLKGEDVLKQRGLDKDMRWINVGIMVAFFVFYRLLCWGILMRKASKSTL